MQGNHPSAKLVSHQLELPLEKCALIAKIELPPLISVCVHAHVDSSVSLESKYLHRSSGKGQGQRMTDSLLGNKTHTHTHTQTNRQDKIDDIEEGKKRNNRDERGRT